MKNLRFTLVTFLILLLFTKCSKDEVFTAGFHIKVENVSTAYDYFAAGAQTIPDGELNPGPAFPGHSFTVKFHAGRSHKLSFATMYGASNDLFYAPSDGGIALFNGDVPLTGDITGMISLWDAGTEVNHAPGSGEDGADESEVIESVRNTDNIMDGFTYNNVETNIEVSLAYDGTSEFTLTVKDLDGSSTPLSPVAWVVHNDGQKPIFTEGELDYGNGLEDLAEMGNAAPLSSYLEMNSGYVSPVAPLVWVLHKGNEKPIFTEGELDYGKGLEKLSELGDPSDVYSSLVNEGYEAGVVNIPDGASGPGPLMPGESYTFTVNARIDQYLSFAFMLGKSNDLFFSPGDMGIRLFSDKNPLSGDITDKIMLWDAGTEVNEYPGAGIHQGPGDNQESENVMQVNDSFTWPQVSQVIKVTITSN
jgi:hypothetical protein